MKIRVFPILCVIGALFTLMLTGCSDSKTQGNPSSAAQPESMVSQTESTISEPESSSSPVSEPSSTQSEGAPTDAESTESSTQQLPDNAVSSSVETGQSTVADTARSLIGTPYRYGGTTPDGFDNPGFIYYCYKENGITVPRRTSELYGAGTDVSKENLQPGDVVFFWQNTPGTAEYAGIYVGDDRFIACSHEEKPTCEQDMSLPYFEAHFVGAKRY